MCNKCRKNERNIPCTGLPVGNVVLKENNPRWVGVMQLYKKQRDLVYTWGMILCVCRIGGNASGIVHELVWESCVSGEMAHIHYTWHSRATTSTSNCKSKCLVIICTGTLLMSSVFIYKKKITLLIWLSWAESWIENLALKFKSTHVENPEDWYSNL